MGTKFLLLVVFFLFILTAAGVMNKNTATAAELAPHLYKTTLDNGLTVLVKETPGNQAATVQIWVRAGSIYEEPDEAGITHLIEHMIFKGTPTRGPGQLAEAIEGIGGQVNAYTSYEYTAYHATLASRDWAVALDVLADAVLHSVFDAGELAREKKVVLEEIRMREDRPSIKLFQELMNQAYTTHPYRLPIIGTEKSVSHIGREKILSYIKNHYTPENFLVVVVGDVQHGQVNDRVKGLMGKLAKGEHDKRALPQEPSQNQARFYALAEEVNQVQMALAVPICQFDNPDGPVLDVIAHILGQGDSSRLYRRIRDEKGLVYKIDASSFTPADPGLLEVTAVLDGAKAAEALEETLTEMFRLKYQAVTAEELERAKRSLETDFIFNLERAEGQARVLGSFEFLAGDPRETLYVDKLRAITIEDVQRTAARYLGKNRLTAGFLTPKAMELGLDQDKLVLLIERADLAARQGVPVSLIPNTFLPDVHRFSFPNGMTLVVRETPDIPTVGIRVIFPGGLMGEMPATNGAFNFISEMLTKGTQRQSAQEIARTVADMAGEVSGFSGKNTFGLKAAFLSRFFEDGMKLIRDIVLTPTFAREEMDKMRPELIDNLKQQEDSLPAVTFREFNRILFEPHPYALNNAGSEAAFNNLTSSDLKNIYKQFARPNRMVVAIAGDVKAEKVREQVARLFEDWERSAFAEEGIVEEPARPLPIPPAAPVLFGLERPKEQVHLVIGFLGTTLKSSDRYAVEVLETILSGQSGRLFQELRDKQSLAYNLSSFLTLGLDTGSFGVYIATKPENKEDAIRGAWKELYRIREMPISEPELEKAKKILVGHYELSLQTRGAQALEMGLNEVYGLGQNFGTQYVQTIKAVTAKEVLAAAQKYIQTERYVMVTVGAPRPQ